MTFSDRREAGKYLAGKLMHYAGRSDVLVLALPRGGVPVAFEVADALRAPLEVFVVRKIGIPGREEAAMGAIASGGVLVLNDGVINALGIPDHVVEEVISRESRELERRERLYRPESPDLDLEGRVAILVDDGLATGSTMHAATQALRKQDPKRLVVAVPVGAPETCEEFSTEADEVICAVEPERFHAVGLWYEDFSQTTDAEVQQLLEQSLRSAAWKPAGAPFLGG